MVSRITTLVCLLAYGHALHALDFNVAADLDEEAGIAVSSTDSADAANGTAVSKEVEAVAAKDPRRVVRGGPVSAVAQKDEAAGVAESSRDSADVANGTAVSKEVKAVAKDPRRVVRGGPVSAVAQEDEAAGAAVSSGDSAGAADGTAASKGVKAAAARDPRRVVRGGAVSAVAQEAAPNSSDRNNGTGPASRAELGDDHTNSPAAGDCLRETTPSLEVSYPDDAEDHFEELQAFFAPWREGLTPHCAAGYCGPWIENAWISHFEGLWLRNRSGGTKLHQIFGPHIPLFFPWTDAWVRSSYHYPENFVNQLKAKLRPNVPYITVNQNDEGLTGKCELLMSSIPNVLVLSAGGYGHVAIPLLKQVEPLNNAKPMAAREYQVSFMGTLGRAPGYTRGRMADIVSRASGGPASRSLVSFAGPPGVDNYVGHGREWRAVMADSRASLCPRGVGRTSYRLMETLQMGLIPIYVYNRVPWVPYPELFKSLGFATDLAGLPGVLQKVSEMETTELEEMEQRIMGLKTTHFTREGTMEQIGRFMTARDGGGDLRCRPLPPDPAGWGPCTE